MGIAMLLGPSVSGIVLTYIDNGRKGIKDLFKKNEKMENICSLVWGNTYVSNSYFINPDTAFNSGHKRASTNLLSNRNPDGLIHWIF